MYLKQYLNIAFLLTFFLSVYITSAQELEVGPMLNLDRTTFTVPDSSVIYIGDFSGEGSRPTGYESNFSFGGYLSYFFYDNLALSGELFYSKTTATEFEGNSFTAINFIPYVSVEVLDINLFVNLGGGIGFITNSERFEEDDVEVKGIDIPFKMALTYRFEKVLTIDLGIHSSVTQVIEDEILRNAYYIGIKVPLNQIL